jgi:hypothetical protein
MHAAEAPIHLTGIVAYSDRIVALLESFLDPELPTFTGPQAKAAPPEARRRPHPPTTQIFA